MKNTLVGNDTVFYRKTFKFKRAESFFSVSHWLTSWLQCEGLVTRSVFPAFISERRQEVSRRPTRSELVMTHKLYARRGVCMLTAHCGPVYEWPGKHWASIHEPTLQGKRVARSECQCMKGRSVRGEAGGKPPCHLGLLTESAKKY